MHETSLAFMASDAVVSHEHTWNGEEPSFGFLWLPFHGTDGGRVFAPIVFGGGQIHRVASKWLLELSQGGASPKTVDQHALAIVRFSEYFYHFAPTSSEATNNEALRSFYRSFRAALFNGCQKLQWPALGFTRSKNLSNSVSLFCDWLAQQEGEHAFVHPNPKLLRSRRQDHSIKFRAEYQLLFHLYTATKAGVSIHEERPANAQRPRYDLQQQLKRSAANRDAAKGISFGPVPKAMPLADYTALLEAEVQAENWRNLALWLVLGGGCARTSEALNMFAADIHFVASRDETFIALANPVEGLISTKGTWETRRDHLARRYDLVPRNLLPPNNPSYAGYKGMALGGITDTQLPEIEDWPRRGWAFVEWLFPEYAKLFFRAVIGYQKQKAGLTLQHPYFFVNLGANAGHPMKRSNVAAELHSACKRAGIAPRAPHALRHTHGSACADARLPVAETMVRMRHQNISSTLVYYNMSREAAREFMRRFASERNLDDIGLTKLSNPFGALA